MIDEIHTIIIDDWPFWECPDDCTKAFYKWVRFRIGFFQAVLEQKNSSRSSKPNDFESQVQDLYNSMGGIGNILYSDTATSKH